MKSATAQAPGNVRISDIARHRPHNAGRKELQWQTIA
jgi:hypothetical protein